jgi:hypothetical protein
MVKFSTPPRLFDLATFASHAWKSMATITRRIALQSDGGVSLGWLGDVWGCQGHTLYVIWDLPKSKRFLGL